jgi:TRAP-type C4-dicarboxylate transport system permease small subunit
MTVAVFSDKRFLPSFQKYLPSNWITGVVAALFIVPMGDPSLTALLLAAWVCTLCAHLGARYFAQNPLKWKRDRQKFLLLLVFISIFTAFLVCPDVSFAQAAGAQGTGVGSGCANLGFLNPLGTLTLNVFEGLTSGNAASTSVSDSACKIVGYFLWALVIGVVSALGYFGVQLVSNNSNFSVAAYPLGAALYVALGTAMVFAIFQIV